MARAVLDSSAILAVVNEEPGQEIVTGILEHAVTSAVNYAEVIGKIVERGASVDDARAALRIIDLQIVDFDALMAERTGALRAHTRGQGLSLGDRACLALAEREAAIAYTADRRWLDVKLDIQVHCIR